MYVLEGEYGTDNVQSSSRFRTDGMGTDRAIRAIGCMRAVRMKPCWRDDRAQCKSPLSGALRDFIASFRNVFPDPPVEMMQCMKDLEELNILLRVT